MWSTSRLCKQAPHRPVAWQQHRPSASRPAAASDGASTSGRAPQQLLVKFNQEGVTIEATSGEIIWEVAQRAGVDIATGCHQGNCGLCEVEVTKHASAGPGPGPSSGGGQPSPQAARPSPSVVRSCVARLPPGWGLIEVDALQDDAVWGVDGFDM